MTDFVPLESYGALPEALSRRRPYVMLFIVNALSSYYMIIPDFIRIRNGHGARKIFIRTQLPDIHFKSLPENTFPVLVKYIYSHRPVEEKSCIS